jgi:hypothetical protein
MNKKLQRITLLIALVFRTALFAQKRVINNTEIKREL